MRLSGTALLIWAWVFGAASWAQSFADLNQQALAAFNGSDRETALALTRQVVDAGEAAGHEQPAAYLEALNNLTFLLVSDPNRASAQPSTEILRQAELSATFAETTGLAGSPGWATALNNAAHLNAQTGQRDKSRDQRTRMLNTARWNDLHAWALSAAVDLAFLNADYTELPALIGELIDLTGGYTAQTSITQLYEQQNLLETQGDAQAVSALVDARILLVGLFQPELRDEFAHAALWSKYYMNHEAENYDAAAQGLREWARTGSLSDEETAFIRDQAANTLLLAQLQGFGDRDAIQLGYTELVLAYAELAYPPEDHRIGLALREMAAAQSVLGLYQQAEATLQDALLNLSQSPAGQQHQFLVLEDLAANAWQRGALDQSRQLFEQAETARKAAVAAGTAPLSPYDGSILSQNRAQLEIDRRDFDKAREYLQQARAQFDTFLASGTAKNNDLRHHVALAETTARLEAESANPDAARASANALAEAARSYYPERHPGRARALTNAADQLLAFGEIASARALLHEARAIAAATLPKAAPLTTEIDTKLALDALASGNKQAAISHFREVVAARQSPEYRVALSEVAENFEMFAWALLSEPEPSPAQIDEALAALQWTQTSQSAESLAMTAARLSAADPGVAALIKRRQDAAQDLVLNRSALTAAYASGTPPDGILARQARLQTDLEAADHALSGAGIALAGQTTISPLTLTEIQSRLKPGEVLVTFLLPSLKPDAIPGLEVSSNLAIAIRADAIQIARIPEESRGALNGTIDAFRCEMAISDPNCGLGVAANLRGALTLDAPEKAETGFDWRIAHDLFVDLFGGIAPLLEAQDHLIIIPPSDLLRLPFQAMITQPSPVFDLADANWLIRSHAISILPSLAAFQALRDIPPRQSEGAKVLGIGDPVIGSGGDLDCATYDVASLRSAGEPAGNLYGATLQEGVRLANVDQLRQLSRLPDATCELRAINAAFGGQESDLLLRERASERVLKSMNDAGALQEYDLLVFATHGVVAGETSAIAPGLVLTPPDAPDLIDDGLLTTAEVASLSLNARLVILSACNTAAGRNADEEGLSGLASGFFHAGARSLMVTHWAVFSDASAEISTGVSRALATDREISNAAALQRVVLDILDNPARAPRTKHPAYWAPFTIVGL